MVVVSFFFFSSRRRHTRCALVTGVQTCALPIFGPGAGSGYLPIVRAKTESWALFGQVEAALTDKLTLIGGARYTDDKVQQTITYYDVPNVCALGSYLTSGACHATPTPPDPSFAEIQANKFTYKVTSK